MIDIRKDKNGREVIEGKNLSPGESWRGIGDLWNGYSALLTDIIGGSELLICGNKLDDWNDIIDFELYNSEFDESEREILCLRYGLMCHKKCDIEKIVVLMNKRCYVWDRVFDDDDIRQKIEQVLDDLRKRRRVKEYIHKLTNGKYF